MSEIVPLGPRRSSSSGTGSRVDQATEEGTVVLSATEADRLSRLRIMLAEVQGLTADQSSLGQHLAIVGADGSGELAIGICANKRGLYRREKGVPATLSALLGNLSATDAPGVQGFLELHGARNQAQHQGVLPAPELVPRWIDETAALASFLVRRCFDVDLSSVGSAAAVREERLSELLDEAEGAIEGGETVRAFDLSSKAIQHGLNVFRRHTGLGGRPKQVRIGREFTEISAIQAEVTSISRRLELSLFAGESGEWMWFEQRHGESTNGLEPSVGEARRGFIFALGWVLRMESYVARHGSDRWERWNRHRAPVTELPGGPHIKDVVHGRSGLPNGDDEWIFQLTDVPDHENPDFDWAIGAALEQSDELLFTHAYLDRAGRMAVRAPKGVAGRSLGESAHRLIAAGKDVMEVRWAADAAELQRREELARPFRTALAEAELPLSDLVVRPADRGEGPLVIWIELADIGVRGMSWFSKCLADTFDEHLGGYERAECDFGFAGATVPAVWPAAAVVAWLSQARDMADALDSADEERRIAERATEDEVLFEIRAYLGAEGD